jgi:hypothetical protein
MLALGQDSRGVLGSYPSMCQPRGVVTVLNVPRAQRAWVSPRAVREWLAQSANAASSVQGAQDALSMGDAGGHVCAVADIDGGVELL